MNPLLELADRAEAATGGDQFSVITEVALCLWGWQDDRYKRVLRLCEVDAYESAAMMLVPGGADSAGERFRLEAYNTNGVLASHVRASAWVAGAPRVFAATPALALVAACLRARAAGQPA